MGPSPRTPTPNADEMRELVRDMVHTLVDEHMEPFPRREAELKGGRPVGR